MAEAKLHLVFGGRVSDPQTLDFKELDKLDVVGIFPNYNEAEEAWRAAAQRTVDDAEMRYVVVHLHKLLDVTIYYPKGTPTFWDYISGKVHDIKVRVRVLPIDHQLIGDYEDPQVRERFQLWVNQLWLDKDRQIALLQQESR